MTELRNFFFQIRGLLTKRKTRRVIASVFELQEESISYSGTAVSVLDRDADRLSEDGARMRREGNGRL